MQNEKKDRYVIFLVFILPAFLAFSYLWAQEHEDIVETVHVENVEVPVRVLEGNQPVGGLTKEDFQLYVNGKPTDINGFYETRKKLEEKAARDSSSPANTQAPSQPRLFVLIFNMSSYTQDLRTQLGTLFEEIFRDNDRLIVITNRYFLPEWEVVDKEKTKNKIMEILDKETHQLKMEMMGFETDLKALAAEMKSRVNDPLQASNLSAVFEEFLLSYQFTLEDIKDRYLSIPVDQYIKMSEYLKSQRLDKWVLNFYQLGRLPLLDSFGEVNKTISEYIDDGNEGIASLNTNDPLAVSAGVDKESMRDIKRNLQNYYYNFVTKIQVIDNLLIDDIGKVFLNSGATVHTQLLNPSDRHFSTDFRYENITTESESILKKLSQLTGGSVVTSNRMEKFIKDITVREDIVYMLTYAPGVDKKKNPKLDIKIKNEKYRVIYDDQRRLKSFREMMARLTRQEKDIEIQSLTCENDQVIVKLKNIQMVRYEGERFGAVQARIKIMDKRSRLVSGFEKVFKGIKENGTLQVKLPYIANGDYNIVLEVKDLFALESVYVGDAISIRK